MNELWYDYLKMKCKKTEELCYMGTGKNIKTEDIYVDIGKDVETRFYLKL